MLGRGCSGRGSWGRVGRSGEELRGGVWAVGCAWFDSRVPSWALSGAPARRWCVARLSGAWSGELRATQNVGLNWR